MNIRKEGNKLIIANYYELTEHIEADYKDGLYGVFPARSVRDFRTGRNYSNIMEWAYNNAAQPFSDIDRLRGVHMGYIDGSGANAVKNIGSMKNIWKEFERAYDFNSSEINSININEIEKNFWAFYIVNYCDRFEKGVKVLEDYVASKRALLTDEMREEEKKYFPEFSSDEIWRKGCRDYLKHLIRKSARGFMMELILFTALKELTGGQFIESDIQNERRGIDGFIMVDSIRYPISLKPSSFTGGVSPVYGGCFVVYNKKDKGPDLIYTFKTGAELLELIPMT